MHHQEILSPDLLSDIIKCFWYTSVDFGKRSHDFEVMPDGYAEIIFHFGNDCRILYNGQSQIVPSPFLMGLLNHPVTIKTSGHFQVIGIRCFPWAVFDLLGLPADKGMLHTFEHPIVQLQTILSPLIAAAKIDEALVAVQQFVIEMKAPSSDDLLSKAGAAMKEKNGTLPVHGVAAASFSTVRTLERKFKRSAGHTVKDVSALMRFERVRNQLWRDPASNLAGLAIEFGYADQSHLSREFKKFSGTTPAAFARKTKKAKEISGEDFVAFVEKS